MLCQWSVLDASGGTLRVVFPVERRGLVPREATGVRRLMG